MTDETYSRQQARADERAIFNALRSLKRGDTGPAESLTEMSFLATSVAALTVAPALPTPAAPYTGLPTPATRPTGIYPPLVS